MVVDDLLGCEFVTGRGLRFEEFLQEFRVARGLFGHDWVLPLSD
jgi:hypothetical protein